METKKIRRITVAEMAPHVHSFKPNENKVDKIVNWLADWIVLSLECGKVNPYDLMPLKADLAYHIGVSQGTIQNAYRVLEDLGYLESKQRLGTYIKDKKNKPKLEKLTSKRELAIEVVKRYLIENNYKIDEVITSSRKIAEYTGISNSTIRIAINYLVSIGIIRKDGGNFILNTLDFEVEKVQTKTLVEKIALKIKEYIYESLEPGDKLPTNSILTKRFKVSVKTIHDAIKLLVKEGILYTRRGRYGTIILAHGADSPQVEMYSYEKKEQKIRQYIIDNCEVGDKLPSIKKFSAMYRTSEKTIKKALDNLADEGYIAFSRGRYGGTFVLDKPQASGEAYKWLAISTDYFSN